MKNNNMKKVLVLDDDLDLQELIRDYFTPRGYTIICHSSAEEGINEIIRNASSEEPFDLVITDFRLPNMNGIELIDKLKRVAPQIPIILVTAHCSLDLAVEAIEKGAFDFVVKPIQFPQLAISMERAVYFRNLQKENQKLKSELEITTPSGVQIIARSRVMKAVVDLAKRVAKSDATVLITGESGTGKEVLAHLIHYSSRRNSKPFIAINCSAIPETLLESELFGHAKGSFTGADEKKLGLFEEANEGTLFLDEIGDLSLPLQAKLLRVIQERKIKRVGENQYRDIDVRLLAATHKNMTEEVESKRFREDLFFRLNVIPIRIPALRERREDLVPLADHFLKKFNLRNNTHVNGFSKNVLRYIIRHEWKGNVRELENAIERAVVLCEGPWIEEADFLYEDPASLRPSPTEAATPLVDLSDDEIDQLLEKHHMPQPSGTEVELLASPAMSTDEPQKEVFSPILAVGELIPLQTLEHRYIKYVLKQSKGVKDRAAKILQVDRKTLYRKLETMEHEM